MSKSFEMYLTIQFSIDNNVAVGNNVTHEEGIHNILSLQTDPAKFYTVELRAPDGQTYTLISAAEQLEQFRNDPQGCLDAVKGHLGDIPLLEDFTLA